MYNIIVIGRKCVTWNNLDVWNQLFPQRLWVKTLNNNIDNVFSYKMYDSKRSQAFPTSWAEKYNNFEVFSLLWCFIKKNYVTFSSLMYMLILFLFMLNFHSGLLTSKVKTEDHFIYICIFKFIICKAKLKVNFGVGALEKSSRERRVDP